MPFELFNPDGELRVTRGNLPHWYQPGATYFITFRTADSLPNEVADLWYRRRNDWLQRHGINPKTKSWQAALRRLSDRLQNEFAIDVLFAMDGIDHPQQFLRIHASRKLTG